MATQKPLVIDTGTVQQIANADTLLVGVAVEPSTGTALRVGAAGGTTTTTFPGPVRLDGDVTTVGGTTFTTDATFEGNVTFGNGPADTVSFAATTTVVSDINFATPVAYKITNLANGTNPNDAVNVSQLSALVTGVSAVTASSPLSSSGGATPDISFPTWPANASGVLTNDGVGTLSWAAAPSGSLTVGTTAIVSGAVNRVLFEGAGNVLQESANLTWDGSAFTVNGVVAVGEGSAPAGTAAFGKLWANSAADARPYWIDDTGQSFNLTLDRFNTLTPAASVAIDTSPALPVFNSLALNQNTTFTTSNLGNGRSASVRVVCDGTTRTLTFPGTWTWLGSGPPADLTANAVGYLSITAYGATDADVVAAWSYENMPAVVTGSGVDNQIAVWSGTDSQDGSANLTFNGTTLGVTGGITQSGGAVGLTANAASSFTTSAGALTLTSAAAATWSSTAGNLAITGGAALQLAAAAGNEVVVNDGSADVDFRVESNAQTHALFVDAGNDRVGVFASTLTHTFNVGDGTNSNFCVASGGRIHTYDGTAPTNGQVLIGDTGLGNFAKATLTAGTGIAITNGAGSISIAASNAGGVQPITTISTTTTLGASNYTVLCSATLTVNLPAAASNTGRIYNIKNIGAAATITIDPNASETIDGATTYTLTTQYESVTIQCDGTAWFIL